VNDACLPSVNDDEVVARTLLALESILTLGTRFVYLRRLELGRSTITRSFPNGGTLAALAVSSTGSYSSTGRLPKERADAMSGAGSIETGAGTPILMKLCERFAMAKESLQGAGL
jgi:hypothetical protein